MPSGRPEKADRLTLRPTIRLSPSVRSAAILELATEKRGLKNIGYLLDDTATQLQSHLGLKQLEVDKRARAILKRLKKR
jgi:hypothetical protein